jgi:DNA-binding NtrC family response regulator
MIQRLGTRGGGPLVTVGCSQRARTALEHELFGSPAEASGDFFGPGRGALARVECGTMLLREVDQMPLSTQAKLVTQLQRLREDSPGSVPSLPFRLLVTASRDLKALVQEGSFREDLRRYLDELHLAIPPLRARPEDIAPLAHHFLSRVRQQTGRRVGWISSSALAFMMRHDWPGNLTELEQTIECAAWVCRSATIQPRDLPARIGGLDIGAPRPAQFPEGGLDLRATVESYENTLIRQALKRTGWNKNQAARLLGINRTTLVEMLKRKGIVAA